MRDCVFVSTLTYGLSCGLLCSGVLEGEARKKNRFRGKLGTIDIHQPRGRHVDHPPFLSLF